MAFPSLSIGSILLCAPFAARRFATHFEGRDLRVGRKIFDDYARAEGGSITWRMKDPALLESFDVLKDDHFDPARVHPLIRAFYERTDAFEIRFEISWNPWFQPAGIVYSEIVARLIDQLRVPPFNSTAPRRMKCAYALIDLDRDGKPDFRGWVRSMADDGTLFYAGAVYTYVAPELGEMTSYLCVAFPLPGMNLTSVLKPRNWAGNGFAMSTVAPEAKDAGTYLIFPGRSQFSMIPALGLHEHFEFAVVNGAWIECRHIQSWLGRRIFTMTYRLGRKP